MKARCERCGDWFESRHSAHVLCGDPCAHARWVERGRRPADPTLVPCACCRDVFLRVNPKRRYCSARCKNLATARRHKKNERDRVRQRDWARSHRDENTRRSSEWARAHPDRRRSIAHARRARERGAPGRWTGDEWAALVRRHEGRCAYCGCAGELTVDHRRPLIRGGSNAIENILPACGWCNRSKGSRDEAEFRAAVQIEGCGRPHWPIRTSATSNTCQPATITSMPS